MPDKSVIVPQTPSSPARLVPVGHMQKSATYKFRVINNPLTYIPTPIDNNMDMSYSAVERRIADAINAINTRANAKISETATEFHVPYHRLQNRLRGMPLASQVRGIHNRRLTPDQDLALTIYYQKLSNAGTPARLNSIKNEADRLLRQSCDPTKTPPPLSDHNGPSDGWIVSQISSKSNGNHLL